MANANPNARKHTQAALAVLMAYLCEMQEVVMVAQAGSQEALDHITEEYHGPYTKCSRLALAVAHGVQTDDDEEAQAEAEKEDARRACMSEKA